MRMKFGKRALAAAAASSSALLAMATAPAALASQSRPSVASQANARPAGQPASVAPTESGAYILQSVTAVSAHDAWAVGANVATTNGDATLIEHSNGFKWKQVSSPNAKGYDSSFLYSVSAASASDVWAVGYEFNSPT